MSTTTKKKPVPPHGRPIPGTTNLGDVEWALTKAMRYLTQGGDRLDPAFTDYMDLWLDYRLKLIGSPLERLGLGALHRMRPRGSG